MKLREDEVEHLESNAEKKNGFSMLVDLESCEVTDASGWRATFSVEEHRRRCLLEGLDEIGATLLFSSKIAAFEQEHAKR